MLKKASIVLLLFFLLPSLFIATFNVTYAKGQFTNNTDEIVETLNLINKLPEELRRLILFNLMSPVKRYVRKKIIQKNNFPSLLRNNIYKDSAYPFSISKDRSIFAICLSNTKIKFVKLLTKQQAVLNTNNGSSIKSLSFSRDNKRIAIGYFNGTVDIYDVEDFANIKKIHSIRIYNHTVRCLDFSPRNNILACGYDCGVISILDVENCKELSCVKGHNDWINCISFSFDGKKLATCSDDYTVRLWDVCWKKGFKIKPLFVLKGHGNFVRTVSFSHDNKYLASGAWDGRAFVWDVLTGKKFKSFNGHNSLVCSVDFSLDNKIFVSGSYDMKVRFWDFESGELLGVLPSDNWVSAFFIDSNKFLTFSFGKLDMGLFQLYTDKEANFLSELRNIHSKVLDSEKLFLLYFLYRFNFICKNSPLPPKLSFLKKYYKELSEDIKEIVSKCFNVKSLN